MSGRKCIFKVPQDDDDDEVPENFLVSPCFRISPNVELKETPTNGEEYLLTVKNERQNVAAVTKCNRDYSRFAKNQSCFITEIPHAQAPDKLKPTKEWQNVQVADFSEIRMYVSRMQANRKLWPSNVKKIIIEQNNFNGWKDFFDEKEPTLTCVLGFRQSRIDRGLVILTEILDEVKPGDTIDHKTGQWIYALMTCTRQPLLSDTISILRDLARKCAEIRAHINQDDENAVLAVTPLNIFICLVAQYFRQYDLSD